MPGMVLWMTWIAVSMIRQNHLIAVIQYRTAVPVQQSSWRLALTEPMPFQR